MSTWWTRFGRRKWSFKVLLVSVCALFVLLLLEVSLRIFRPVHFRQPFGGPPPEKLLIPIHQRSSVPGLIYELTPNREVVDAGVLYRTNEYGMRGEARVSARRDSLRRIAALGDGYTFGGRLPVEAAFPSLLGKLLNESAGNTGERYNVLNFGVLEYSTADELAVLKYKALAWDPDVVILGYNPDDPEPYPLSRASLHGYFDRPRWWQHSHLLRMLARLKFNREVERLGGGDYLRYLHAEQGESWKKSVRDFSAIRALTSEREIPVLVVLFPYVWQMPPGPSWPAYQFKEIHKQVSDLSMQNGFRVIDLYDVYSRSQQDPNNLIVSQFDNHPNRLGQELVAHAIAQELSARHDFYFKPHRKKLSP